MSSRGFVAVRFAPLAILAAFIVAYVPASTAAPDKPAVTEASGSARAKPDGKPTGDAKPDAKATGDAKSDGKPTGDALADGEPQVADPSVEVATKKLKATNEKTLFAVIKLIGGLIALLALAYLGGHRRVIRFQEQLGISGVITAGFPFVAIGAFASWPTIGILDENVLRQLRPVLHFGLGWLGFIIGTQLDIRVLDRVPKGTAYLVLVEALGPFGITAAGCGAVMFAFGLSWDDPSLWRNMILLGAAAAMTAPHKFRGFVNRNWREGNGVDVLLGQLDELVGVVGLLFITAYFRDFTSTTWALPSTAWVFVSLGLGVAIGVLIFAMIRVPVSNAEFLAVVLGGIAFASGLAGYLMLSPIVICFLAGVLVTNFPNDQRESVFRILVHLERPVQLLFLIIAGAVWNVGDWRGWALVPLFVVGRVVGKWTGVLTSKTAVGALLPMGFADQRQPVQPMSGLSIALVVSVSSLYVDPGLSWVITAVIGGAIVTEVLVQLTYKPIDGADAGDSLERGPVDELDDGPVYRDEVPAEQPPPPRTNVGMPGAKRRPPYHDPEAGRSDASGSPIDPPASRPPLPPALRVEKSQPLEPATPADVDARRQGDRSWFGSPQADESGGNRGTWHGGPVARGPAKKDDGGGEEP